MPTILTESATVRAAKERLDAEQLAHKRRGYVHDDVTQASWDDAYDAWMQARAADGDAFALSLGYTATGWSFEQWIAGHKQSTASKGSTAH